MQEYLVILQEKTIMMMDQYSSYLWWFLALMVATTSAYNFTFEANETKRFVYEHDGMQMYCTVCATGMEDKETSPECKSKNQNLQMPGGGQKPMCKEGAMGGVIPGCGPLPTSDGLSWRTESGRPVQTNSTVYEVYTPQCSRNSELNRDTASVRCWETLRWDVDPADFRCTDIPFCSTICIIGIGAGVGALVLVAVVILVVYAVYRSRRKPPVPTEESDDAPLKESTYRVSNTPGGKQPETKGDSKGNFVQMKQESGSA